MMLPIGMQAQKPTLNELQFVPLWGEIELKLGEPLPADEDSLVIEKLRFYISKAALLRNGKTVWADAEQVWLIDAGVPGATKIKLNVSDSFEFDTLVFYAGIDSATNCSGAMQGALDAEKGMYWTWQSGYIHTKLEARGRLNHELLLHLGGYRQPYNTLRLVKLPIAGNANKLLVEVNLKPLVEAARRMNTSKVMQPGKLASDLSDVWGNCFKTTVK